MPLQIPCLKVTNEECLKNPPQFFNGDQDIEDKLESLKSEEWTEKELKCFYRIFLTAAAREKRHDIVDVMLHLIRRQGGYSIVRSPKNHCSKVTGGEVKVT